MLRLLLLSIFVNLKWYLILPLKPYVLRHAVLDIQYYLKLLKKYFKLCVIDGSSKDHRWPFTQTALELPDYCFLLGHVLGRSAVEVLKLWKDPLPASCWNYSNHGMCCGFCLFFFFCIFFFFFSFLSPAFCWYGMDLRFEVTVVEEGCLPTFDCSLVNYY